MPIVYLDTNVFIAAFEGSGGLGDDVWPLLEAVERGELHAATCELTLAEVLVHPLRRGDAALVAAYEAMIAPSASLSVVAVDRALLTSAARLRAERPALRLPDALHLAAALRVGADLLVTRDVRLRGHSPIPTADGGSQSLDRLREVRT